MKLVTSDYTMDGSIRVMDYYLDDKIGCYVSYRETEIKQINLAMYYKGTVIEL